MIEQQSMPKGKRIKERLSDKFKQISQQKLHRQPPTYLLGFAKQKQIQFDIDVFQSDDMPFVPLLLSLPVNKIRIFRASDNKKTPTPNFQAFHETSKFKDFLKQIAIAIGTMATLKSVIFQGVPMQQKHMLALNYNDYLASSSKIKQFAIKNCCLTDGHLDKIKNSLAKNQSLVILDFSHNKLSEGGIIGKILSEHSIRRDQMVWMASLRSQQLEQDLSKKGICEINLQKNQFGDRGAIQMIEYLKDDQWTRCVNLRDNRLTTQGIQNFARLMKKNYTIVSLDLRGNPGLTKEYSVYMFKKLKGNIERYKEQKKKYQNPQTAIGLKNQNTIQHKSMYHSQRRAESKQKKTDLGSNLEFNGININNTINFPKSGNNISTVEQTARCGKCKNTTVEMLKLEKQNLDLHLQIKKLRHVLLTKNIEVSAIFPNPQASIQQSSVNQSFHRANLLAGGETDEELLIKVQQIMNELTKIMENIEGQQNTQINISNHLSNANSLSRTIPLFQRAEEGLSGEEGIIENSENDITS